MYWIFREDEVVAIAHFAGSIAVDDPFGGLSKIARGTVLAVLCGRP
jgi:hypothetical protein